MKPLSGDIQIIEDYENLMKENTDYTYKAIISRKSKLRKAIEIACSSDCDRFAKEIKTRNGYIKIVDKIKAFKTSDKYKANILNAVNIYKNLNGIDYGNEASAVKDLVRNYGKLVSDILYYGDIIRSKNIVGEYAEYLCEEFLGVNRCVLSNKNIDGINSKKETFQIKARWITSDNNGGYEFGKIELDSNNNPPFDYFVGIIFDEDMAIKDVVILDKENIKKIFTVLHRSTKVIRYTDIYDNNHNVKHGLTLTTAFDNQIKKMKKFANN